MGSSHALHPPTDVQSDGGGDCWGKRLKACLAWLGVLSVSVIGGLMLGLWTSWYHPTNSQLWMVPFGLVLLVTPVLAWVSVVASEICCHVVVAEDPQGRHRHKHPPNEPLV
ncbi:hypothetical protein MLD38_036321 [Melastoma candidum]|uniref:Uncharacterized protein n=1 Tax=Melastoma candidum TaxID=119954 RepID=A0ACB9LK91_9MYRT|nr:hypothetical protein MLD38_036321 [Melastoma candidum]